MEWKNEARRERKNNGNRKTDDSPISLSMAELMTTL